MELRPRGKLLPQVSSAARAGSALDATVGPRLCRFEEMEERQFLAADIHLGAVYFEDATGDDSQGDTLQITFQGGAAGTELTRLVIDGDKDGLGPSAGDIFFDTADGGKGAFGSSPLTIVSHDGFQVLGYTVSDGGSRITFDLAGFKAGMKLVFTVDTDEIQFVDPNTGAWDVNALVEGGEFQRSHLQGDFVAPDHQDATGHAIFWDAYDEDFAEEAAQTGTTLNLPPDRYNSSGNDLVDRTAGAVTSLRQTPLPGSLSGYVHADMDGDCVFDPEEDGIANVVIQLLDATGNILRTTKTDAFGQYRFDDLALGEYQIRELQPEGYLDSGDHPGSLGGIVGENDLLSQIHVGPGQHGVEYHFCEVLPAALCGYVYHDANNNGIRDANEQGIAGAAVALRDANGNYTGHTEITDASGRYCFENLTPGTYTISEVQPLDWLDGMDAAGTAGGTATNPGDTIAGAVLTPGLHADEYNFGELLPASIRGRVHADTNGNCTLDPGEKPIAGVTIQLFDAHGTLVATTKTNAAGEYQFENLLPGIYTVHELQPAGYFDGGQDAGSAGGVESDDTISQIPLGSGVHAIDYNFCEKPPATISGYVFQDGAPILVSNGQTPNVPAVRDGLFTADDTPLAGVVLELRDGVTGRPILGSETLGGYAPNEIVTVTTNASGQYEFTGLRAGSYAVYQRQDPDSYLDGLNTAGSTGGLVMSAYTQLGAEVLSQLTALPASGDALLRIVVTAGGTSTNNNFSEVATQTIILPPPPPLPPPPTTPAVNVYLPPAALSPAAPLAPQLDVPRFLYGGTTMSYTWHLSVVDAGHPRGDLDSEAAVREAALHDDSTFKPGKLKNSTWKLATRGTDGKLTPARSMVFGLIDSVPITGDFNGDGMTDVGVFKNGEWFIDVNGNGQWDADDLWAKLGSRDDKPVTGDWNGDGKTDIGIYGPAWPRDPHAIRHEPGIPDPANTERKIPKNLPPDSQHAAIGTRDLKLSDTGSKRADLIDHVFHYGAAEDVPVAGDWNGDGIDTIGVFHGGRWHLDLDGNGRWSPADLAHQFGRAGDKPVTGDWNGDGRDDLGIYRAGKWYLDTNGNDRLDAEDEVLQLGGPNDQPVVGDWDGDGRDEVGIVQNGQIVHSERLTQLLRHE